MQKSILLAGLLACSASTAFAQKPLITNGKKIDAGLEMMAAKQHAAARIKAVGTATTDSLIHVTINAVSATTLAEALENDGYKCHIITDEVLTARIPAVVAVELAKRNDVYYVKQPRRAHTYMDKARVAMGADKVQKGTDLETPYKGKGVIIGVIDQGFEYQHKAFLDKDGFPTRVRAVWDLSTEGSMPLTTIPTGGDNWNGEGHATHVTSIAAGGDTGNDLCGVAPEAEIVMMPSSFDDSEVQDGIKYVKDLAEREGKPWIVNMSFGTEIGPHDGTGLYCQTLNQLAGDKGILVAAMGNSGTSAMHASYAFENDTTVTFFIGKGVSLTGGTTPSSYYFDFCLWSQATDGVERLSIKPFLYVPTSGKKFYFTAQQAGAANVYVEDGVDPYNKKQQLRLYGRFSELCTKFGLSTTTTTYVGVEVTGEKGDVVHSWINNDCGVFTRVDGVNSVAGDFDYQCSEAGASAKDVVAVASYNSRTSFTHKDGNIYSLTGIGKLGETSKFSSHGPSLNGQPRPTVAAPGTICAAVSKYDTGVNYNTYDYTVNVLGTGLRKYYYAYMNGTSMATPAAAGTIALWLEANPKLTREDILTIIRETSTRDAYTGSDAWDKYRGFGKINAYEGLKKALQMASTEGINDVLNSDASVTLLKGETAWKVLFNNNESFARINVYTLGGRLASTTQLSSPRQGEEHEVTFSNLKPGVYFINIVTTKQNITRKVVVK